MCVFVPCGVSGFRSHLVQLGAGGGNLLNSQLAQLSLQLAEGLGELWLVLGPQLAGLDLAARLRHCQYGDRFVATVINRSSARCGELSP